MTPARCLQNAAAPAAFPALGAHDLQLFGVVIGFVSTRARLRLERVCRCARVESGS